MKALILAYFLAQPWHVTDGAETLEYRTQRLGQVAQAITEVANNNKILAALLAVTAAQESGLRRDVQFGACPEHLCDRGRAVGLAQLHRPPSVSIETWRSWAGPEYENQLAAFTQAANLLRHGLNACRSLEGAIGLYATGLICEAKQSTGRARAARELARKL